MDTHVVDASAMADSLPELLDFFSIGARDLTADYPWVVWLSFEIGEQVEGRGPKMNYPGSGLGIGEPQATILYIDLGPFERHDLVQAAAGKDEEANG